ncbi:insulin-like growth factor-binding protein complex acid labile subunit [Lucilia sericata]|uniref:insulin-like growth factor-binding protein complex acid labile subunit n=1 Tax=Lucilia sericata TaxID=13632 RepID=UPI0018A80969|nr:insulin-like growth factor-binding protein complex acid labile subunit [Lucilia sericata]
MTLNTPRQREFLLLLPILITTLTCLSAGALQLDLKDTCSGSSLYYCTLTNLTSSFEEPLVWNTKSTTEQLNELLIYNSVMGRLPSAIFEIAPKLHTLIMHNCALNNIMPMDFEKASQLHKLVLQRNRLFIIPERVFAGLFALEELYLSHNTIHMIHRYAFVRLQRLKYLDLQENGIRTLPEGVFEDLINVEHIDLSYNELEVINANTFLKNLKLNTLLLSGNNFSVFEPNSLMNLNHLHILDLSNTYLEELQLQSVDLLLVQGSKLKRCTIDSVIKLNAANNALKNITIHDKLAVRELELHGNLFETLDDLVGMLNLQKLDISKNQLSSLKTSHSPLYLPLPNLISLNLASNRLQNLTSDNFVFLLKLKSLDLAFNHLIRLDSSIFQPLINLENFYVEGNRLYEFNYAEFKDSHTFLREVGIFENDWEFRYLKHMLNYFRNRGIHLPMRFTPADSLSSTSAASFHDTTDASVFKSSSSSNVHRDMDEVDILNDMNRARQSSAHLDTHVECTHQASLTGVSGIHPYWTTRDVLALITLIVVLVILILQFFRILQEERCLPSWCRCCLDLASRETEPLHPRHRPLVEDTTNV